MFRHSEAEVKRVQRVQFGILGPEEIKAMSVCHCESDRTFEAGKPVQGGLMDLRLGSIDRFWKCTTCGMEHSECPGHFGHIELAKPMYHTSFIKTTLKLLRCVCRNCSVILSDAPDEAGVPSPQMAAAIAKKSPQQRLRAVMACSTGKRECWSCSASQPAYKREGLIIRAEYKKTDEQEELKQAHPPAARTGCFPLVSPLTSPLCTSLPLASRAVDRPCPGRTLRRRLRTRSSSAFPTKMRASSASTRNSRGPTGW